MKINSSSKYFFITLTSLLLLSACSNEPLESPEVVLKKAKEAVIDVNSGKVEIEAMLKGKGASDDIDVSGGASLAFDGRKEGEKKLDLNLNLSGLMKAADKSVNGDLDFEMVSLGNQYYVKLNKLSSNDESLVSIEPFINMYKEKWLRIAEDFIPENIRNLQNEDEASELKRKQLEDLFLETEFFQVSKEYGVEKIDGEKTYRYALTPIKENFKTYMSKTSLLDGQNLTEAELDQAVAFLDNLKKAEFFIGIDDYAVKRVVFGLSGDTQVPGSSLNIDLTLNTSDFNDTVEIEAPESAEDFNPLNLIMGLGSLPGAEGGAVLPPEAGLVPEEGAAVPAAN